MARLARIGVLQKGTLMLKSSTTSCQVVSRVQHLYRSGCGELMEVELT